MLFHKLARLLYPLALIALLGTACGGETTIDAATAESDVAQESSEGSDQTDSDTQNSTDSSDQTEPTAVPATPEPERTASGDATVETADDEQDTTEADRDGDVIVLENREQAVAFITSEGFIQSDAECIVDGAYQVFGTWDFVEADPDPQQDEELDRLLDDCVTTVPGPAAGSPPPGTNAELDALWTACDEGSAEACDSLFWGAPVDSDYEAFGLSCGGRAIDECSVVLGG